MIDQYFLERFIAEFAVMFLFILFIYGWSPPFHSKSVGRGLFGLLIIAPLFLEIITLDLFTILLIYIYSIISSVWFGLIPLIKFKGKAMAFYQYEKVHKKPRSGINERLRRINMLIKSALSINIAYIGIYLTISLAFYHVTTIFVVIFGLISLISLFIIQVIYYTKGHIEDTNKIDPKKVDMSLNTLFYYTQIFVLNLIVILLYLINIFAPEIILLYIFVPYIAIYIQYIISEYMLSSFRLMFFRNKRVAPHYISNIRLYSISTFLQAIILSDIPILLLVIDQENIKLMVFWVMGLCYFMVSYLITIYKQTYFFELEAGLLQISEEEKITFQGNAESNQGGNS